MVWIEFAICSILMILFAYKLCEEGIAISKRTRLEESIIGMVFIAVGTSFPEVVVGVTSVFSLGRIGLGYGDLVGSVIVNSMLLLLIDLSIGKRRLLSTISRENTLTALFIFGVAVMIFFAGVLRMYIALPRIGPLGVESLVVIFIYGVFLRAINKKNGCDRDEVRHVEGVSLLQNWARFTVLLILVMILGIWMARIGEKIVVVTGLSQTFTGTLLLGLATSFPEIIVTFSAIKAGSFNMAAGNVLGSNLFDLSVIPVLDFMTEDPIMGMLTNGQVLAAGIVLLISLVTIAGIAVKKPVQKRVSPETGVIFAVGLVGFVLLYFIK
jgi:cation:H+ antiporter